MKVSLQRLIKVWVEERYDVEEITDKIIQDLICHKKECYDTEVLWETQEDLESVEIYNENDELIYQVEDE